MIINNKNNKIKTLDNKFNDELNEKNNEIKELKEFIKNISNKKVDLGVTLKNNNST